MSHDVSIDEDLGLKAHMAQKNKCVEEEKSGNKEIKQSDKLINKWNQDQSSIDKIEENLSVIEMGQ